MDLKLVVLLLAIGAHCASGQNVKPDWWIGKGRWYGSTRPWTPGKPPAVWEPLVLIEAGTPRTQLPNSGVDLSAGDRAVIWSEVACPANAGTPVVGDCSATGLYLEDVTAANNDDNDGGLVDWTVVCRLTSPCGNYGVGTIISIGRGVGTNGVRTSEWAIVGGTGAYAGFSKGGVVTNSFTGTTWRYEFRFVR